MTLAAWSAFIGVLLIAMVLVGSFLARTPLTAAIVYLGLGALLGPAALDVLRPDPIAHAAALRVLTEVALLVALFAVGLELGVPMRGRQWGRVHDRQRIAVDAKDQKPRECRGRQWDERHYTAWRAGAFAQAHSIRKTMNLEPSGAERPARGSRTGRSRRPRPTSRNRKR